MPGQKWDLIVTMDDATSEHYSMFFVDEEGTQSSFQGIGEVIRAKGLFSSLYTDRGSHYWHTPEAGGKVDKNNLTQFGRAMKQLGIEMIPAYSPEARGRSERAFGTHQDRFPKELALYGITDMEEANRYLQQTYLPAFNAEFCQPPLEEGSAFVEWVGGNLDDILCEQYDRQRRARQLRLLRGDETPDPPEPAPVPLHQGHGPGASLPRRHAGRLSRPKETGNVTTPSESRSMKG